MKTDLNADKKRVLRNIEKHRARTFAHSKATVTPRKDGKFDLNITFTPVK